MAQEPGPLGPHPGLQLGDARGQALPPDYETFGSLKAVDLPLDGKDRVDALDRRQCKRSQHRQPATRLGGDVGEHEESAARVGPTRRLDERPQRTCGAVEPVEPGKRVSLQHAREAVEVTLGMLT